MKRVCLIATAAAFLLGACAPGDIGARQPWARAAMMGQNSAVYFELSNDSRQADALIGASSDVAGSVEIHKSMMTGEGVMQMVPQESVPLEAGAAIEFAPGGFHIMLIGLTRELKAGDHFQLTLHFKTHADIILDVVTQEMEGMDMPTHMP